MLIPPSVIELPSVELQEIRRKFLRDNPTDRSSKGTDIINVQANSINPFLERF